MAYLDYPIIGLGRAVLHAANQIQCFSRDSNRKYFVTLEQSPTSSPIYVRVRVVYTNDGGLTWQEGVTDSSLTFGPLAGTGVDSALCNLAVDYDKLADKLYILIHTSYSNNVLDDPPNFTYGEYPFAQAVGSPPPFGAPYVGRTLPVIITVDCATFTISNTQDAWFSDGANQNLALLFSLDAVYTFKLNAAKNKYIVFFQGAPTTFQTYSIGADTYIIYYMGNIGISQIRFWTGSLSTLGTTLPVLVNIGAEPSYPTNESSGMRWEMRSLVKDTSDIAYLIVSFEMHGSAPHYYRLLSFDINTGVQNSTIIDIDTLPSEGAVGKPLVFTRSGVKYIAAYVKINFVTPLYVWLYDLTNNVLIGRFNTDTALNGAGSTAFPNAGPGDMVYDSSHDTLTAYWFGNVFHGLRNIFYSVMDLSTMSSFGSLQPLDSNPRNSSGTDGVLIQGGFNDSTVGYKVGIDFPLIYYNNISNNFGYTYILGDYPVTVTGGKWKTLEV